MSEDSSQQGFLKAFKACYGWKKPVEQTKNSEFSLALQLIALAMFVARFFWFLQLVKLMIRWRSANLSIPPLVNEIYFMGSVAIEACICGALYVNFAPLTLASWVIALICSWKLFEVITHNIYYILLRPALELNAPHNLFRSLVIAAFGCVETWLILSLLWYYCGTTTPELSSIRDALYFTAATFFTVGYGDIHPTGQGEFLAIASMIISGIMLLIVLSRAVSIQHVLPTVTLNTDATRTKP